MTRIQLRRDTAAAWSANNPVLAEGEQGYETDTGRSKRGNGTDAWGVLPYVGQGNWVPASNGSDDTATIQSILDSGGEIVFPKGGTWLIDAETALTPVSNSRIIIEDGATLQVIANDAETYQLFNIDGVESVTISGGGTLLGDSATHTGSTGQWGHIIQITNGASNINIVGNLLIKQAWGDGIYIGASAQCTDIIIDGVTVDDCRREGIAPFWVDGCTIRNCRITNIGLTEINPTGPGSGIDCEPASASHTVSNLVIENNWIENTACTGIYITSGLGTTEDVTIRDNTITGCGATTDSITTYQTNGIHLADVDRVILIDNVVTNCGPTSDASSAPGQIVFRTCTNPVLRGGVLNAAGKRRGLYAWQSDADIQNVTITGADQSAIAAYQSDDLIIRDNTLTDNVAGDGASTDHIALNACDDALIDSNTFIGPLGRSWVRVESSCDNLLLSRNTGIGTAPTALFSDGGGSNNIQVGNINKISGGHLSWSSSDESTVTPSQAATSGLLGWTIDPSQVQANTVLPAAATIYFCLIPIRTKITVTNVLCALSSLGNGLTHGYVGLWGSDGTLLGQSADQATAWDTGGSTAVKTVALTAPATVIPSRANDWVWTGIYVGTASTTLPGFMRGTASYSALVNAGATSARWRYGSYAVADTATLPTVTPTSMSAASHAYWMAIS